MSKGDEFGAIDFGGDIAHDSGNETRDVTEDLVTPVRAFRTNDVAVLFPLPAKKELLLGFDAANASGVLFPEPLFDALNAFNDVDYALWKIVAMRIDPCSPIQESCDRQIRLVSQPVLFNPEKTSTLDHAIHLTYSLSENEFATALNAWMRVVELFDKEPNSAFAVNPMLERGLDAAVGDEVRGWILNHTNRDRLRSIAFMNGTPLSWTFGAFEVDGDVLSPFPIPGISPEQRENLPLDLSFLQTFSMLFLRDAFTIEPRTAVTNELEPLSGTPVGEIGGEWELPGSELQIVNAIQMTLDLDNPDGEHSNITVDCVSCHIASRIRGRAVGEGFSDMGLDRYENSQFRLDEDSESARDPRILRAFGYFESEPSFTQRTINESAQSSVRSSSYIK